MANITRNDETAPIVVPPSGHFGGNDGPWSTFDIHVGTPLQPVRVLVTFSFGQTQVIGTQDGCLATDASTCAQDRGGLFNPNLSSTWQEVGIFALAAALNLDGYSGEYDLGDYGFDAMGLGLAGSGGIRFESQTISAIATTDFYLGYLGLNRNPTNFTDFGHPQVSFLESMKASRNIPSLSYAYSAGAQYRNNTLATLTLGGYDGSRALTSDLSISMAPDNLRDLVVSVQSIILSETTGEITTLSSSPFWTFIDATVAEIWLSQEACSNFEDAFGLLYDSTINRYLVNDTLHHILQKRNASVSFLLGNDPEGAVVNITLPYGSFDLSLGPPVVSVKQNYFPLRRAANEFQYTLGRTFLQESYLIVDHERGNFSVSQNEWYGDTTPQIIPISSLDVSSVVNNTSTNHGNTKSRYKLPASTIVSISVATFLGFMIAVVAAFYFVRRLRRSVEEQPKDRKIEGTIDPFAKAEMDGSGKDAPAELNAPCRSPVEADSSSGVEMPDNLGKRRELAGSRVSAEIEGSDAATEDRPGPVELYARTHGLSEAPSPSPPALRVNTSSSKTDDRRERPSGKRKPQATF